METITWREACKIPNPKWVSIVFWRVMILFWKSFSWKNADMVLPQTMDDVLLKIRKDGFLSNYFHMYNINNEFTGLWDSSPFEVQISNQSIPSFIDHGEPRHFMSVFLEDVLKTLRPLRFLHPELNLLCKIIHNSQHLKFNCNTCSAFFSWNRQFLEELLIENNVSVAPSVVLFFLQYRNQELKKIKKEEIHTKDSLKLLKKSLTLFLESFFKIQEQTRLDPIIIARGLVDILIDTNCTLENINETEDSCSRYMKSFLFNRLKFLKTKSIQVKHFPRHLLVAREVFVSVIHYFHNHHTPPEEQTTDVGQMFLMNFLFSQDECLKHPPTIKDQVLFYDDSIQLSSKRFFSEQETKQFVQYHPLLRSSVFND